MFFVVKCVFDLVGLLNLDKGILICVCCVEYGC